MKTEKENSRKVFVSTLIIFILLFTYSCQERDSERSYEDMDIRSPDSGEEALTWLIEGNDRFVEGKSKHMHESALWRERLTQEQRPFATIIGCSDSRVPIELIFDQGFGDLFIIRVAGNVLGPDERGSIAYAVAHLHTPLILVLGHEGCGAVTAAMLPDSIRQKEPVFLQELLNRIDPSLENIDRGLPEEKRVAEGVEANVIWSVEMLHDILAEHEEFKDIVIAGAVYDLGTGEVRLIGEG